MFDFAWSEIALIGVVALIAIGPKDMPVAIKAATDMLKKARRMAAEFQGHVDEMVREADLHDVRDQIKDLRRMDIKGRILNAVDGDGVMRRTLTERVVVPPPVPAQAADAAPAAAPAASGEHVIAAPEQAAAAPAFIPPVSGVDFTGIPGLPSAPAFIPPQTARPMPTEPSARA